MRWLYPKGIALLLMLLLLVMGLVGCTSESSSAGTGTQSSGQATQASSKEETTEKASEPDTEPGARYEEIELTFPEVHTPQGSSGEAPSQGSFSLAAVPAYSGNAFVAVHGNVPFFTKADLTAQAYEEYASLDARGRCGVAVACIGRELMPTEGRGSIGQVKPTGWQTIKYDHVDGKYLYNRCHLIGFQLTAENANARNLITGTRYMNVEGMLPFENMVADYIKETNNHVLYRVTPVFDGNNLLASGVLMEAYSVEDAGDGICYCVFVYNVQPGVAINYATGNSTLANTPVGHSGTSNQSVHEQAVKQYVLNTNTHKFHTPNCSSVSNIKSPVTFTGTRDKLLMQGYSPCGNCRP